MMKFTNPEALVKSAERFELDGWYIQSEDGDYLGVLRNTELGWVVGKEFVDVVTYPIVADRIPV